VKGVEPWQEKKSLKQVTATLVMHETYRHGKNTLITVNHTRLKKRSCRGEVQEKAERDRRERNENSSVIMRERRAVEEKKLSIKERRYRTSQGGRTTNFRANKSQKKLDPPKEGRVRKLSSPPWRKRHLKKGCEKGPKRRNVSA